MTSIQGDRATVNCAKCNAKVIFTDVIRRYVDWQGEWIMVLYAPFIIHTDTLLCPDCEIQAMPLDEWLAMVETPAHDDDSNHMIVNHYHGI